MLYLLAAAQAAAAGDYALLGGIASSFSFSSFAAVAADAAAAGAAAAAAGLALADTLLRRVGGRVRLRARVDGVREGERRILPSQLGLACCYPPYGTSSSSSFHSIHSLRDLLVPSASPRSLPLFLLLQLFVMVAPVLLLPLPLF